jgi:cation diffusion facilitator CzcD-associated flavoprotein CzcO
MPEAVVVGGGPGGLAVAVVIRRGLHLQRERKYVDE